MSHYLYLDHVIQNDNCDLYSTQYIFNLVSHYFYSAHDTNEVVSYYRLRLFSTPLIIGTGVYFSVGNDG